MDPNWRPCSTSWHHQRRAGRSRRLRARRRRIRPGPPRRVAHLVLLNTIFGHQPSLQLPEMIRLLADPTLTPLADAMITDEGQRLWLLQHTANQWGLDAPDPDGLAIRSILPQFYGDTEQPDALAGIRA